MLVHDGLMHNIEDPEIGARFFPGVDLTLWMQLILIVLAVVTVGAVALAVA